MLRDHYLLERELGRGGMATVYLAQDLKHRRPVALKVLDPELAHALGPERFRREIDTAARLQHPNVLPVHDSGEVAGHLWYTMPYVEGESLRERLQREGRLPVPEALRLAREIADALNYAHRRGVIHRDIKPGNILLSEGHALVADFGIARQAARLAAGVVDNPAAGPSAEVDFALEGHTEVGLADALTGATLTSTGMSLGTPAYMSPEQALGTRHIDGRSDQYAVACVLYEMLAGVPPYRGDSARALIGQHLTAPVPNVRAVRPEVSQRVSEVLARALAKQPDARFANASELASALERAAPVPTQGILTRYGSRRGLLIGTAVLLAMVTIGVAALSRLRSSAPLDGHLVAVAPFEVLVPELAPWRERMIDHVSRHLDGAGPLRAVPTTTVLQRWRGRADVAGAVALGRRTGAGLVVYGQLDRTSGDSVALTANLVDAGRGQVLAQTRRADVRQRVDRAADQLTVAILRQAGNSRGIRRAGLAGFESRSPAAMHAALAGEQFYRHGLWDSAIVHYKDAVELDSSFTLAQRRLGRLLAWNGDEDPQAFLLRAAQAPGLSWIDSSLITADSISAALRRSRVPLGLSPVTRLLGILEEAVWQQGRSDPEVWYQLAEARYRWGGAVGASVSETLRAFERAIALDSGFAPAYAYGVELKLRQGDPAGALWYFDRLRALGTLNLEPGTTARAQWYLLWAAANGASIDEDSVSTDDLRSALRMFVQWPDSGLTTISMARALLRKSERASAATALADPSAITASKDKSFAVQVLARKGQLVEAGRSDVTDDLPSFGDLPPLMESVLLGAAPAERVERDLRSFRSNPDDEPRILELSRWCGVRGDTVCLRRIMARAGRSGGDTLVPKSVVRDASAFLALARHDTSRALRAFTTLIDSVDKGMTVDLLERARLLAATGRLDDARVQYSRASGGDGPLSVVAELELAEVAERRGAREQALEAYRYVAATWKHADPVLQSYVARARAGLARLAANPGT